MHEFMTINKNKFLTTKVFTKMVKLSLLWHHHDHVQLQYACISSFYFATEQCESLRNASSSYM